MNCRTARKLVQAQHDGTLAAESGSALQEHFHACSACSRHAGQLHLAQQWLRDLPVAQPSDNFEWRLKLRLAQAERENAQATSTALPPSRRLWTLQFVVSTAAAALLVLSAGIVFSLRQDRQGAREEILVNAPPSTWAPNAGTRARTGWPRLVPVRSGVPLGPELDAAPAPSILGQARADTTFLDESRRGEPIQVFPVRY